VPEGLLVDEELDRFKRMDLAQYAGSRGYRLVRREPTRGGGSRGSTNSSLLMRMRRPMTRWSSGSIPESSWDFFTWEETERLLAACRDEEERALLMFAVHTGARAGEQLALAWGNLDWHNHLVVFRRSSTRGIVGPTKSGRERKVPLTGKLEAALRRDQTPPQRSRGLQPGRIGPDARSASRALLDGQPASGAAAAALARSQALVGLAGGDGRRPDHPGAAVDGTLDDRDDDALRPSLSRGGRGLDPDARSACESTAL
jgi:integrase